MCVSWPVLTVPAQMVDVFVKKSRGLSYHSHCFLVFFSAIPPYFLCIFSAFSLYFLHIFSIFSPQYVSRPVLMVSVQMVDVFAKMTGLEKPVIRERVS